MTGGPLAGLRVVEFAGIGPGPFACMLLADMGADVVRVDRPGGSSVLASGDETRNIVNRGRRSIVLDLKQPLAREAALGLIGRADVVVEGFRPGVMERLGFGPDDCLARNPKLVYGRITGWGQQGPLAPYAGHDINYISLSGVLWGTGRADERPVPALNIVGDYAGGALYLVFGLVCAVLEASRSGLGQVVDAAMVDGVASLSAMFVAMRALGAWRDERGVNPLDTGYPHYEVYECADGKYVAVGALEPAFYAELVARTGFTDDGADRQSTAGAPRRKAAWAALFRTRTRDEWAALTAESDACLTPVLDWAEAPMHPHHVARGTYVTENGIVQPAPAPRLSRTSGAIGRPPPAPGQHTVELLAEAGLDAAAAAAAVESGAARTVNRGDSNA